MPNGLAKVASFSLMIAGAALSNAQIINFESGSGSGTQDSSITAIAGNQTSDFSTLTAQDFTNARNGANAYILSPLASGWVSGLGAGSTAKWVGLESTAGNNGYVSESGLYAMNFDVASAMSSAKLNLIFSVDDQLGGSNNAGLYLDGVAIPGSSSYTDWNNQIESKSFNLGGLSAGTHTLYFDVVNSGNGPAGIIFKGNVQAVPEPTSMAALGIGAIGLIRRRRAKKA
jgi:hypothetical protein